MHTLRRISYYGFLALLIYMPFHIFLAQSLSLATGGLDAWKTGKDVVLALLTVFTICLVFVNKQAGRLFYLLLGLAVAYGLLHFATWALNPDIFDKSALLGIVYNNRLPCFLLLGFGAAVLNPDKFVFSSIIKVLLAVSTVVAFLAVLQYFLPKDILSHLGYGLERGTRPAFFIDDNPTLPRVMSTLREPNALGAYLVLPITLLTLLIARIRDARRTLLGGMLLIHLLALFLTFSRSAWLAAALALVIAIWWQYHERVNRLLKKYWPMLAILVVLATTLAISQRNSTFVQHYITHSTEEPFEDLDSNDYHRLLIWQGAVGVVDQPVGHGPGTAGLASIQNPAGAQLTENYYLQIAYEIGVLGLIVFIALNIVVYIRLLKRRDWLAVALLAVFWGYVLMNMFLHTWSNEAVAAQWWLLAGAAIATSGSVAKPRSRG